MKYFLDTEFIENGSGYPIDLISIGVVAEDGREFYAISNEFRSVTASSWVYTNVITPLMSNESHIPRERVSEIRARLQDFIGKDKPEFWGYYADYDWVVLCQMFGAMVNLPSHWPKYCRDIKQLAVMMGDPDLPVQTFGHHNALADARHVKVRYEFLRKKREMQLAPGPDADGVLCISAERARQIEIEGWTSEHDDGYDEGELNLAAQAYVIHAFAIVNKMPVPNQALQMWPWAKKWLKPSADPIRNLEKAGALIAAEIDRLKRKTRT